MMPSHYPYRNGTLPNFALGLLFFCALTVLLIVETNKRYRPDSLHAEKMAAIKLMQQSVAIIKTEKIRSGIKIDPLIDTNGTGMIGERYNDLTTTVGSLPSKRTSTNPSFAAAVVEMLARAGVHRGDPVAISFSSSFPALNVAVLSAVHTLGLKPVIISSVGASMYGANDPNMTWLDMESLLEKKGVFPYRSVAASLGGISDTKGGIDGTGLESALLSIRRNNVNFLDEGGVSTQRFDIRRRLDLYSRMLNGAKPAAFINVGASQTSLGNSPEAYKLPTGLLKHIYASDDPDRGIIFHMQEQGIPVIHLLKIKNLAKQFGIPFDPAQNSKSPHPADITVSGYSRPAALIALLVLVSFMALLKYYFATDDKKVKYLRFIAP
jgi:poly-gamma-glutamate system protein